MKTRCAFALLGLFVCCVAPARADSPSEARAHYRAATSHFAVGEFEAAAREYQAAYKLRPDAALLYNAAQAFRLGGNNREALTLYRNYANFYPRGQNMAGVRDQMERLEEIVKAEERAKDAPPHSTAEPQPTDDAGADPKVVEAVHPAAPPKEHTPIYKRWWPWTIVGVVVVGAVVAGAVVATRKPAPWSTGPEIGPSSHATGITVRW